MPTNAKIETLESYYEFVDAERYDALFDLFAEDIVYHRPGAEPIRGKPAFEQFYLEERPLEDGTHEIHEFIVDGDRISVRGQFDGVLDGEPITFGFADIHAFRGDGVIERRWTYVDIGTV
jgi:ketosteroid isomerase-like protein